MARYAGYDLDKLKRALGQKEWEAVLHPFHHVRMATQAQIEFATGLSYRVVNRTLKALTEVDDVAQDPAGPRRAETEETVDSAPEKPAERVRRVLARAPRRLAYRAYHTRPATIYLLGQAGAALLRERGLLKDTRACEIKDPVAQGHRLCLLDIILLGLAQGQTVLLPEKDLPNGEGQVVRADVALPTFASGGEPAQTVREWRLVAVEQQAGENNARRVELQVERWWSYFAGAPGAERVSPVIMMVFNLKQAELPTALTEWQGALAASTARSGAAPFQVHYTLLVDFMQSPAWQTADWQRYPRLAPTLKPVTPRVDPLEAWTAPPDFKGLLERAVGLHTLARGAAGTLTGDYGLPKTALLAFREWLNTPAMEAPRRELSGALGRLAAWSGALSPVVILTKMAWDIVLRAYGIERRHFDVRSDFQVAFVPPEPPAQGRDGTGYGDYHARVSLASRLFDQLREAGQVPEGASPEGVEAAVEWMLTALYVYAYELDLRSEAWLADRPARSRNRRRKN